MNAGNVSDAREVTLLELLDRVIDHGVILAGDITIAVADVDLVYLGLRDYDKAADALEPCIERLEPDLWKRLRARIQAKLIGASEERAAVLESLLGA